MGPELIARLASWITPWSRMEEVNAVWDILSLRKDGPFHRQSETQYCKCRRKDGVESWVGVGGGGAGDNICKLSAEIKPYTVDCCSFKSGCIQILSHPPAFISFMEFLPNPTGVLSISLSAPNGAESKQQESSSTR